MFDPPFLHHTRLTRILLVRHTDVHNPRNIVYGRLPRFGLSDLGREQAAATAAFLRDQRAVALYTSPRLRARQSAEIINRVLACPRATRSNLIDEVLTGYQGQSNDILKTEFNFYDRLARPDDETIAAIATRMTRFLETARRRHRGQTVVAVSHADPIMICRTAVLGLPLTIRSLRGRYYPAKGSVMEFAYVDSASQPVVAYFDPIGAIKSSRVRTRKQEQRTMAS